MTVLDSILEVFNAMGDWIGGAMEGLIPIFYTAPTTAGDSGELTFIGILAVAGLSLSIVLMLFNLVRGFLRFS